MPVSTPSSSLRLHLVPAGRRLDFGAAPGHYASVFRRTNFQSWECIAQNACSPLLDQTPPVPGVPTEYVVLFHDPSGELTAATPIVAASPAHLPVAASHLSL